ncbi:hypothetical protein GCM10010365_59610 [Streptomyces poonensis]|uniref:Uncharacterized protein n=1 Tax=Streptomyces poonensis TaxID=68255 RepID=A0A918Q531_9ACTN|nr:hypothetical protein GCM10010365_59610 [Streptomyces poonensis]GLJ88286.1 hypothetical protein GCM10017589_08860 [Streptomyces poonensis]
MPITVSAYRFGFRPCPPPFPWASAAGAATPPASATPAPVTADLFRNLRRFNGMTGTPRRRSMTRVDKKRAWTRAERDTDA